MPFRRLINTKEDIISKAERLILLYGCASAADLAKSFGFIVLPLSELNDFLLDGGGCSVFDEKTGKYLIIYDDGNNEKAEFIVAHEMGHILLGHFKDGNLVSLNCAKQKRYEIYEEEADFFAKNLLNCIKKETADTAASY